MKLDNLDIDSLFDDSFSNESTEVDKMIDEVFSDRKDDLRKSFRIEVISPKGTEEDELFGDNIEIDQEKLESILKEAVGSEAVEKVLDSIEEGEKFTDYIDDSIYMRNQDIDISGIECALIRGCRIEKRLNSYRNKSEECKKECEKLMEYEFFLSLNRMAKEGRGVELPIGSKEIPNLISEDEYIIIKDNIENYYEERLASLKEEAKIIEIQSYIIIGENEDGEERIISFIEDESKALDMYKEINLKNTSLSFAKIKYVEEGSNKIILDYEIINEIK